MKIYSKMVSKQMIEHEAEMIVDAKVKELMYGGPYYAIVEPDEDDE